jgi:uncharacterized protein (TIGR02246 family)
MGAVNMSSVEQSILNIFDRYKTAVWNKNVDGLISLYTQDVCVFDLWGEWVYQGRSNLRNMVTGWFSGLGEERDAVEFNEIKILFSGELAVAHAFVRFAAISSEGNELRALDNRLTWTLNLIDGEWKISHQHTSAPIDFNTMQVLLSR